MHSGGGVKTVVSAMLYDMGFVSTDVQSDVRADETWLDVEAVVTVVEGVNEVVEGLAGEKVAVFVLDADLVLDAELVSGAW